jgi:hypothetical protein
MKLSPNWGRKYHAANDPSNTIRKGKSVEHAVEAAFVCDTIKSVILRLAPKKRGANLEHQACRFCYRQPGYLNDPMRVCQPTALVEV